MNKKKIVIICLAFVCIFRSCILNGICYERKDHDQYMTDVMFKYFKEIKNDAESNRAVKALGSACYLAIDQFNNSGEGDLKYLQEYGVKNIPQTINEISFNASGKTHRSFTHRGWDFKYTESGENYWLTRKNIIINTVDKVFNLKSEEKKKESFAAVLYYIHILGDHLDDTSYKVSNGLKIDVGGRSDDYDIINELKTHIQILFKDQSRTHKYRTLLASLEVYDKLLGVLMRSEGQINTDAEFELKQFYTKRVMKLLTYYFPEMLKSEKFFSDVFYF